MSSFKEFSLFKGRIKIKFFNESHQYWVNGKRKTGVTTILGVIDKSRPLVIWATELFRDYLLEKLEDGIEESHIHEGCSLHEVRKAEAASIGDEAHTWIEQYIKGEDPEMPETREAQIAINAFLDWVASNKVKFISSERVVYSKKHDYVGKMDIEAKVNGKLCLIDIKTSNSLYNTYALQTAAYVKADEEESGKKYHGRWLIRLAKESEKDYIIRMKKKNQARERKGKDPVEFESYKVFEAKYLDDDKKNMDRDYKAFICAKTLFDWNKETDYYANK